ncbi:hypothetical protein E3P86_01431 [Wallemia ichthyophaga]|uniref:Actin cytoskeleton-regulatory complex protein SLA1 n=1 Tax=Wallemia ichthyophaga TaxID=245174 RepID=A0A4T0J7K7_WALIC|nr:hypothetical protein E3P86_01431 [Wallemia ichthyophaga]
MIKNLGKANYDYSAGDSDEMSVAEGGYLLILDDSEAEWLLCKATDSDQSGLVPGNYLELVQPSLTLKAVYEYTANSDDELSFAEDDLLDIYNPVDGDDWLLTSRRADTQSGLGYIPANYTQECSPGQSTDVAPEIPTGNPQEHTPETPHETPPEPPVYQPSVAELGPPPAHPSRSSQPSQKSSNQQDPIQTWPITSIDAKKKRKGTLGIGNAALFFSSDNDKNPVEQFSLSDLSTFHIDKNRLYVSFSTQSLEFLASDRKFMPEIDHKIRYSSNLINNNLDLDDAVVDGDNQINSDNSDDEPLSNKTSKGVHFKETPPSPIEAPQYSSDDNETSTPDDPPAIAIALYDFAAESDDELSVKEGDRVLVLDRVSSLDWWTCKQHMNEGVIPASYLRIIEENVSVDKSSSQPTSKSQPEHEQNHDPEEEAMKRVIAETHKRNEASTLAMDVAPAHHPSRHQSKNDRQSKQGKGRQSPTHKPKPNPANLRLWHDKTGQFKVDAEFLGLRDHKLRLLKVNGVTIEVPREKMSKPDLDYIDGKGGDSGSGSDSGSDKSESESGSENKRQSKSNTRRAHKVKPTRPTQPFDWFDFFLQAGCGVDECDRYARNFERDRMDEGILLDIDSSTLRTLGLKEGDILRVNKAISARRLASGDGVVSKEEQIRRDEAYARQIEQEAAPPPNLFASGPGGVLKNTRRGRPTPRSPVNDQIDEGSISVAKESLSSGNGGAGNLGQDVNLLDLHDANDANTNNTSNNNSNPKRSSSTTPLTSGFDDDAWTVRDNVQSKIADTPSPISAETITKNESVSPVPASATGAGGATEPTQPLQPQPTNTLNTPHNPNSMDSIMAKIAANKQAQNDAAHKAQQEAQARELAELRVQQDRLQNQLQALQMSQSQQQQAQPQPQQPMQTGLPIPSHLPAHMQMQAPAKGPVAPLPQNQSLLQPLIPTNTGLSFRPTSTSASASVSPGLTPQQTGLMPQQTGMQGMQGMQSQMQPQMQPLHPQLTSMQGFTQQMQPKPGLASPASPVTSPTSTSSNQYNPSSVFASMRSGQFDAGGAVNTPPQPAPSDRYDALRAQPTGMGYMMPQQTGYMNSSYRPY